MPSAEFTITNKLGVHARPAAQFVKIANSFDAEVVVEKDGEEVDGRSIMGLMMLAAGHGSILKITTEGPDENESLETLGALIKRDFENN
ncbi:HPr family phosphocarrier protein [Akkermansiaceae bacterium]|nr:HPr family phosphocarrier protein [Akkermansiaceae bacterium]